jgi:hypothetical protein
MRISDARLRREEAPVRAAVHGARVSCGCLHRALRQYLYFCTSEASKLSACAAVDC